MQLNRSNPLLAPPFSLNWCFTIHESKSHAPLIFLPLTHKVHISAFIKRTNTFCDIVEYNQQRRRNGGLGVGALGKEATRPPPQT